MKYLSNFTVGEVYDLVKKLGVVIFGNNDDCSTNIVNADEQMIICSQNHADHLLSIIKINDYAITYLQVNNKLVEPDNKQITTFVKSMADRFGSEYKKDLLDYYTVERQRCIVALKKHTEKELEKFDKSADAALEEIR